MTINVMVKIITLIAIGMMGLVVIIMQLDGITIVQLVNALIPMLVEVQIVKTNGRPRNVKKRQTKEI